MNFVMSEEQKKAHKEKIVKKLRCSDDQQLIMTGIAFLLSDLMSERMNEDPDAWTIYDSPISWTRDELSNRGLKFYGQGNEGSD